MRGEREREKVPPKQHTLQRKKSENFSCSAIQVGGFSLSVASEAWKGDKRKFQVELNSFLKC